MEIAKMLMKDAATTATKIKAGEIVVNLAKKGLSKSLPMWLKGYLESSMITSISAVIGGILISVGSEFLSERKNLSKETLYKVSLIAESLILYGATKLTSEINVEELIESSIEKIPELKKILVKNEGEN